MRIAHVTATFPPYYGGAGSVCYYSALGLARMGHRVTVYTADHPPGTYEYPPEITVQRLPVLFRVGNAPILPTLLGLENINIIHLHYPFIFGAEMIWAVSRARRLPYVLTHHNDLVGKGLRGYLFDAYFTLTARLIFGGARKLAVVSFEHAYSCRLASVFRTRWRDVVEIPNGVDVSLFHPDLDGRALRERYGMSQEAKIVLFVGALDRAHHFKGVPRLLEAFGRIRDPDARLMIVGEGDLQKIFVAQAEKAGVTDRTLFVGGKPHKQLAQHYAAADIVVLPSLPPESFGLVLIEAMACGKPVIASNLQGVRAVVTDGQDGLLVEPGNVDDLAAKLRELLASPDQRQKMGTRGREKVEAKYDWQRIVPRLAQVYEEVLA